MPKKTFSNLSIERQQAFKLATYQLFCQRAYNDIGIRDIVETTGIALGSFYRYFSDKDSMYLDFFCEIEEKIMHYFDERSVSFFKVKNVEDFSLVLTPLENKFGRTWFNAPGRVLYKFYFEGYADRLHKGRLDIFINLEQQGKLIKGIDAMFAFHYYKTSYFNMLIYLRQHNITDDKTIFKLRRTFHQQVTLRGLLTDQAFKEVISEGQI